MLSDADKDRLAFIQFVDAAMHLLRLSPEDVAEKLPVSVSAVKRWRKGYTVPLPAMRKPVYRFFLHKLIDRDVR